MRRDVLVVLVTCPAGEVASKLGRLLVEEKLAACVNVVGPIRSVYWWEGAVQEDEEALLVLKTTRAAWPKLRERILAEHPYEVPEVLALPVEDGAEAYLDWVGRSVSGT